MTYDPAALFEALAQRGIEYVLIGGWAVNAHGYRRFTGDIDICPSPDADNLARLAGLVRELGGRQLGLDEFAHEELPGDPTDPDSLAEGGNFRLSTQLGTLDLMQWVPGVDADHAYAELARDAVEADLDGAVVRVCSLDRLLDMKRAAGRPQDLQDLAALEP
jgi:hypothetical protein